MSERAQQRVSMHQIFLHIGLHKTGSTAVQSAFHGYDDGRVVYAPLGHENHSIPFYTVFSGHHQSYHIWRRAGLGPEEIDKKRRDLEALIRTFLKRESKKDIIFSGEDISVIPSEGVADLAKLIFSTNAKIMVIAYVRSPLSFIASNLQESIKAGLEVPRPAGPEYRNRIEKFIVNFGRENVIIRDFSRSELTWGDVVRDFAEIVKVENPLSPATKNESLSTEATRVLYLINQFVSPFGETRAINQARQRLLQHVQSIFPGRFTVPEHLLEGLVDEDDLNWLFEVASIDFRRGKHGDSPAFDPVALHRYLNEPESETLEALRAHLVEHCGVETPPKSKEFLIARYFMSFLKADIQA